jgi:hypothetical protein
MANGFAELKDIQVLLSLPYPDAYEIKSERLKAGVWVAALERLESRLILANTIHENKWWNGPRSVNVGRETDGRELSLNMIQQTTLLLDAHIVSHASRKYENISPFPIKQILQELLRFKASLTDDPSFRMLYHSAYEAILNGRTVRFPNITVMPYTGFKARIWYKNYANYKAILKLIEFPGDTLSKIKFDNSWVKEDEGIVICLFSYCIASDSKKHIKKILVQSEIALEKQPSLKQIHNAMQVF